MQHERLQFHPRRRCAYGPAAPARSTGRRATCSASRTCIWASPSAAPGWANRALPPYETRDTLTRLEEDLRRTGAATVICLGDSFDDAAAAHALPEAEKLLDRQACRPGAAGSGSRATTIPARSSWAARIWPSCPPRRWSSAISPARAGRRGVGPLPPQDAACHARRGSHAPGLPDRRDRVILPAYGTYTGGLRSDAAPLADLMGPRGGGGADRRRGRAPCHLRR